MLDKHSCEMFYTQKLPSKVSQGDTKMRVDLHHGMYGVGPQMTELCHSGHWRPTLSSDL